MAEGLEGTDQSQLLPWRGQSVKIPYLRELVHGDDPMLASKAAYAASLLEGNRGQDVIAAAAEHSDAAVRVAAAAEARNLPASDASDVL